VVYSSFAKVVALVGVGGRIFYAIIFCMEALYVLLIFIFLAIIVQNNERSRKKIKAKIVTQDTLSQVTAASQQNTQDVSPPVISQDSVPDITQILEPKYARYFIFPRSLLSLVFFQTIVMFGGLFVIQTFYKQLTAILIMGIIAWPILLLFFLVVNKLAKNKYQKSKPQVNMIDTGDRYLKLIRVMRLIILFVGGYISFNGIMLILLGGDLLSPFPFIFWTVLSVFGLQRLRDNLISKHEPNDNNDNKGRILAILYLTVGLPIISFVCIFLVFVLFDGI
jgi:biopolymer transport protein ExbB/TolQ